MLPLGTRTTRPAPVSTAMPSNEPCGVANLAPSGTAISRDRRSPLLIQCAKDAVPQNQHRPGDDSNEDQRGYCLGEIFRSDPIFLREEHRHVALFRAQPEGPLRALPSCDNVKHGGG